MKDHKMSHTDKEREHLRTGLRDIASGAGIYTLGDAMSYAESILREAVTLQMKQKSSAESGWEMIESAPIGCRAVVGCWAGGQWLQTFALIECNPGSKIPRIIHEDSHGPAEEFVTHYRPTPTPPKEEA